MADRRDSSEEESGSSILADRAFLASIVECSDDAIIGKSLDGVILSWNAAAEKMYGFSAEQAIGRSILVVVPPDRQDEIPHILERIKRGETVEHYETKRMDKYGEHIYVSVTVSPIKNPNGDIVGASTVARDISGRKRAEEALQRASAYNRSLIEASLDPLVTISVEGKITDVNAGTEKVTGYSRSELIGTDFADYFTDPSRAREGYQQAFRDGSVGDYELEIRHKDGGLTHVTYNASVYSDESGKILGLFAAARDISARKKAEEALAKRNRDIEAILNASTDSVFLLSSDWTLIALNEATAIRHGYASSDLLGKPLSDIRPPDVLEQSRAKFDEVIQTGRAVRFEVERDGRFFYSSFYPVLDADGRVSGVAAYDRDVTEAKRAELERERLIAELEAKNAELERFTYSVSHDLRSPLITIRTFLGFVAEQVANGNTENLKSDLDRIDKAAEKMGILLGEILELSRIGRMFNPPAQVSMADLINEVLELLSGRIAQHGVVVEIDPNLPVLYVDRPRLSEVFQNLIENSLKFMGDQPHPKIEIGANSDGDETIVFVRDNGKGIEPLYHEKIFGLFNKLEPNTEGTGIGLALVKRIVEVHGVRIWVESDGQERGTTFFFALPCAPDGAQ